MISELNFSRKRRLPIIHGVEAAECGLACMSMIAKYHGHDVDLGGMRQKFTLSMSGATLRSIMELADQMDFSTRALRVELGSLSKVTAPAILHWNLNHFVVLKSAGNNKVVIHDPALGRREFSYEEVSKHFTGVVLEITPSKSFTKIEAKQKTRIRDLWSKLEGFWLALFQILGLSVAFQVAVFAAPFYLQLMVDEAVGSFDENLALVLALGFGGLLIIQVAISALRSWAIQSIGFLLSFQMTGNLVRHLLRLPTSFFEKRHVGDIMSRLGSAAPIRDLITTGFISTIIDGVMAIILIGILFVYSSQLALVVLASLVLTLGLTFAFYPGQRKRTEEQIIAAAKEQTHLIESVRASTTVKLMGRESERESAWRNLFANVINASFSIGKYSIGMTAVQTLLTGIQSIVIVYLAVKLILQADGFSVGMLFAFMSYRQTLTNRVLALISQAIQFKYLSLHLERIGDIIHAKSDRAEDEGQTQIEVQGNITVRNLSFRYGAADPLVLKDVSLEIKAGEFIAFTGLSGGGKTTLFKLMLGLYEPEEGEILLDGRTANKEAFRQWRSHVGVVSQDDQLLSGTIADNIAFFDPDLDMKKVQIAAMAAQVHNDIVAKPMQYLSLVGDMGSTLSGGQRQRVLLARALYRQPKILMLDEGTANLDPETENQIADLIAQMPITRIIVAHRPALIERADKVFEVRGAAIRKV
ncbi:MAG: peptidase domain-containing ABC transporter [Robiginitomaculum sp.]|nr:peptidase domain-containing ABC transporter [Robiginitomaculum sp.]